MSTARRTFMLSGVVGFFFAAWYAVFGVKTPHIQPTRKYSGQIVMPEAAARKIAEVLKKEGAVITGFKFLVPSSPGESAYFGQVLFTEDEKKGWRRLP